MAPVGTSTSTNFIPEYKYGMGPSDPKCGGGCLVRINTDCSGLGADRMPLSSTCQSKFGCKCYSYSKIWQLYPSGLLEMATDPSSARTSRRMVQTYTCHLDICRALTGLRYIPRPTLRAVHESHSRPIIINTPPHGPRVLT